ncbi:MAG: DUF1501 domain-containing protein [Pseudomonadota bacterium]
MMNRRHFLRTSCLGLGVGAGFASNLASFNAFAADTDDYKALVCVFFFGAMDSHDMLLPYDQSSYNQFENIREPLLAQYDAAVSRRRSNLLALNGNVGGRRFAFPQEYGPLHELYQQGDLAIVGNVGPMIEPLTRTTYSSGAARRPAKLFSHNDQQSTWMASRPEGATTGWGGRFADMMQAADANAQAAFTAMSVSGNSVFLSGDDVQPFVISSDGAATVNGIDQNVTLSSPDFNDIYQEVLRDTGSNRANLFRRDVASVVNSSLDNNGLLAEQLALPGDPMTAFPGGRLSSQLQMVAKTIARRNSLGMKRQIFFVSTGGFDTHSGQATDLPGLQADIAGSVRAFYDSLVEMGVENSVTTFTASDFGRTLGVNGDGTDHGWGSHHMVLGGAVNGGQVHGDVPPPELGHNQDAGRGRLIPQLSVDQYAAALGSWFGLSNGELNDAIPGLDNFDRSALSGLF